jgi:hypothetical protein
MRFLRLTKLLRVMRLKIFKELQLLVSGFFYGLRTGSGGAGASGRGGGEMGPARRTPDDSLASFVSLLASFGSRPPRYVDELSTPLRARPAGEDAALGHHLPLLRDLLYGRRDQARRGPSGGGHAGPKKNCSWGLAWHVDESRAGVRRARLAPGTP